MESDEQFVADMEWLHSHDREAALPPEKMAHLFTLARRGAAVQMISQRLVQRNRNPPVIETTYITREPYTPPAGETND